VHNTAVRPPTAADLPLLALLHEQTPPAQREESGTTDLPAFGYLEDGVLLAVARARIGFTAPASNPEAERPEPDLAC
jgi:hypothetical protein